MVRCERIRVSGLRQPRRRRLDVRLYFVKPYVALGSQLADAECLACVDRRELLRKHFRGQVGRTSRRTRCICAISHNAERGAHALRLHPEDQMLI